MRRPIANLLAALFRAHVIASYTVAVIATLIGVIFENYPINAGIVVGMLLAPLFTIVMLCQEAAHLFFKMDNWLPRSTHIAALGYMLLMLLLMLVFWLPYRKQREQRRRHQMGLCVTCGYDLRGSPERCPECGTAVPSTEAKT